MNFTLTRKHIIFFQQLAITLLLIVPPPSAQSQQAVNIQYNLTIIALPTSLDFIPRKAIRQPIDPKLSQEPQINLLGILSPAQYNDLNSRVPSEAPVHEITGEKMTSTLSTIFRLTTHFRYKAEIVGTPSPELDVALSNFKPPEKSADIGFSAKCNGILRNDSKIAITATVTQTLFDGYVEYPLSSEKPTMRFLTSMQNLKNNSPRMRLPLIKNSSLTISEVINNGDTIVLDLGAGGSDSDAYREYILLTAFIEK